jgi:multiple sugar transport system permease protein
MPRDLLAAGRIDGCSEASVFWYIALPLSRPIFALVAFFSFVANWNNFFLPYVMLTDDSKFNLPVGLTAMVQTTGAITANTGQTFMPVKRPEVALTGLLMIVPIVLVFIFSQRFVQAGFLVGAEKG